MTSPVPSAHRTWRSAAELAIPRLKALLKDKDSGISTQARDALTALGKQQ